MYCEVAITVHACGIFVAVVGIGGAVLGCSLLAWRTRGGGYPWVTRRSGATAGEPERHCV